MPTYVLRCPNDHEFELFLRYSELDKPQFCECGEIATRQFRPPMIFVQKDICYDSPVDGRPITSKQARLEDLKRHGCVEYEPGMKQDQDRRMKESEIALDKSVDATVEREVALMPAHKKEQLVAELHGGVTAEPVRITPPQQSDYSGRA